MCVCVCVCVCVYTYSSQYEYTEAVRAQQIKKKWDSSEWHVPMKYFRVP
jgi:hypothetical protein